jgi:predicted lipid-binding transport protein (Tim44 family)
VPGIVIFAMIAVFLGLRLYAVLGRRTGHEQSSVPIVDDIKPAKLPLVVKTSGTSPAKDDLVFDQDVAAGLRAINTAESGFDPVRFIDGARSAYKMILEAFWRADEKELATLASDEVRASFADAIAVRTEAGHVLDNRLIEIEKAVITRAWVDNKVAHIMVQFVADIAAVTRDKDGKVVAGSMTDAVPTTDVWTFSRPVRAGTTEWTLTDTDESA